MKLIQQTKLFTAGLLAIGSLAIGYAPQAQAADYAVQKTIWSFAGTATNNVNQATNVAAAVDASQFSDFLLEVRFTGTNSAMTTTLGYTIAWQTSADNSNWGTVDNVNRGWFSVPTTNVITTVWTTNITLNSMGYWRANYLTNSAGQCITNLAIKAWVKPKRTSSDF